MDKILPVLTLAAVGASLAGCERVTTEPVVLEPNSGVIRILDGDGQSDTVLATLEAPIRIELRVKDEEGEGGLPIIGAVVRFDVDQSECGSALEPQATTNSSGQAASRWRLGTRAEECGMGITASSPGGVPLASAQATATALPGQPVSAWLPPGGVDEGADSLVFTLVDHEVADAWGNPLRWRLRVVEGPATVRSDDLDDPGSRTLVATGTGTGTVEVVTPHGPFLTLDLEVCGRNGGLWVQLYRPGEEPAPPCG